MVENKPHAFRFEAACSQAPADELLPLVYDELRHLASVHLSRESPGQTLQPTALVHEAWLRLNHRKNAVWNNRTHFFRAAAQAMRRILVEKSREKASIKRGQCAAKLSLDEACGGDQALRARVEQMLSAQDIADTFFNLNIEHFYADEESSENSDDLNTLLGHYQLKRRFGGGGFGTVYLAEQLEPIRRPDFIAFASRSSAIVLRIFSARRSLPAFSLSCAPWAFCLCGSAML